MDLPAAGVIKCHKCRHVLVKDLLIVVNRSAICDPLKCSSYNLNSFVYLSDDKLPDWIKSKVEEEQWTKGKITCEQCRSKVGSFDYVSGRKCECQESILPPVHLVGSQVDRPMATHPLL